VIRILLVDDQRLIRRCVAARLNAVADFSVVAEAASGEEAREIVRAQAVDVILMDLNMPGMGGIETTRRMLASAPKARIVALSMYDSGPLPKQFLACGGAGYLSKNADSEELVAAIRTVHAGGCHISADVARHIAHDDARQVRRHGLGDLSRREVQVLQHIACGLEHADIARLMFLSAKTVAHHRRQLLTKLGARNDVQLAAIARDQGLLEERARRGD